MGTGGEAGQREAVVVERRGVERVAVEGDGVQLGGPELDEGVAAGPRGEVDDCPGAESLLTLGEVEGDLVAVDVDESGSGLRLVALQLRHAAMLPYGRWRVHGGFGGSGRLGGMTSQH